MKKANWKVGEKVQVPYICWAPMRSGWNGWIFADGTIIQRLVGTGKNKGVPYAKVRVEYNGKTEDRQYKMDNVFAV